MKYLFPLTVLAGLLCCGESYAIVNIESMRPTDEVPFAGKFELSLSGQSGNSDTQDVDLGTFLRWNDADTSTFAIVNYAYGESNQEVDTDKKFAHLRRFWKVRPDFGWEAFVQWQSDEFKRLKSRELLGGGARWAFDNTEKKQLFLGLGSFYERERIASEADTTDAGAEDTVRLNAYVVFKQELNPQTRLLATLYAQPAADDFDDYRLLANTSLSVKMSERWEMQFGVDVSHDNQPPQEVEKTDVSYKAGFSYSF